MFLCTKNIIFSLGILSFLCSGSSVLAYENFPQDFYADKEFIEDLYQNCGENFWNNENEYRQKYSNGLDAIKRLYEVVYQKNPPTWINEDAYKDDIRILKGKSLDILIQSAKKYYAKNISDGSGTLYVCSKLPGVLNSCFLPQFVDAMHELKTALEDLGTPSTSVSKIVLENKKEAQSIQSIAEETLDGCLAFVPLWPVNFSDFLGDRAKSYKYTAWAAGLQFFQSMTEGALPGIPNIYTDIANGIKYAEDGLDTVKNLSKEIVAACDDAILDAELDKIKLDGSGFGVSWVKWPNKELPEYPLESYYVPEELSKQLSKIIESIIFIRTLC